MSIVGKSCDNGTIADQIAGNRRQSGAVRLFSHLLRGRLTMAGLKEQNFDYFLVLDFEATCQKNNKPNPQVYSHECSTWLNYNFFVLK